MMNLAISDKLGMAIGDWQALMNIVLLIFVIIFGGRNLGFGTLANMFLVGYSLQFSLGFGVFSRLVLSQMAFLLP